MMGRIEEGTFVFEVVSCVFSLICNVFGFPWDSIFLYIQVSLIINRLGTKEMKSRPRQIDPTKPVLISNSLEAFTNAEGQEADIKNTE